MAKKTSPEIPGLFDDLPEEAPREQIARITFNGWKKHLQSFQALEKKIEALLDEAVKKTLARGGKLTQDDIGRVFQKHPEIRRDLENAINQLNKELKATIEQESKEAWLRANATGSQVAAALAASNAQLAALLAQGQDRPQNERALQAFMKRKQAGMNLSDRVWKTTMGMKLDMERAIDVALAEGTAADKLSQRIRHLLHEPHRLYRRVRDSKGNLRLSSAAQKYHPGTGVYRSSYMNAMRVARTEVNMAYQTSDTERWTNSWWVKGIRVSLSNNHTTTNGKGEKEPLVDICDELKGDYPPDFKFTGWHPQCRCFATAITCDYDEIREYYRRKRAGEDMSDYKPKGLITEPPANFKRWLTDNQERLAGAAERGTTPYFITNNQKYVTGKPKIQTQATPKKTPLQIADERHAKRRPEDIEKIQKAWAENRIEKVWRAIRSELLPRQSTYTRMNELQKLFDNGQYAEFNQKIAPLLTSAYRHQQRTPADITRIQKNWDANRIKGAKEEAQLQAMRDAFELQKIKDISDIDRIMGEFYKQFPEETNHVRVDFTSFDKPVKDGRFTMGWSIHDKEIAFNSNVGNLKKSPLQSVVDAFEKIRTKKKLSLDQLRQVETVVHELLHQKAGAYVPLRAHNDGDYKRTAMETMNELAARATTARFMRRVGANTEGVSKIMTSGDGYASWVKRVIKFCEWSGQNPGAVGHQFAQILTTKRYDTMDAELYNFFKTHAPKQKNFTQTMDEVLEALESGKKWDSYMNKWFND